MSSINHLGVGIIIMISIFGFTSVMDGHKWSKPFEISRCILTLIYFFSPNQINIFNDFSSIFNVFIVIYISLTLISIYFISLPEKIIYAKG